MQQIPGVVRKLILYIVERLAKYLDGPDCGEVACCHMLNAAVGGGVAELASAEHLDGDTFFSWFSCDRSKT